MKKFVSFGELMLRLCPPGYQRFVQATSFDATYAGGEANVAVSLASFGMDAAFVSAFPAHEIGQAALNALRRYGVDTRHVLRQGDRLGSYYVERGASQRASKVIYDRKYSAVAMSRPEDYDWDTILDDSVGWFHFTGITPALSDSMVEAVRQAARTAHEKGITVSCDLNYRKNLWSPERAGEVMASLMPYVDVLVANEEDCQKVFGISAPDTDVDRGEINYEGYKYVACEIERRFGIRTVATTLRKSLSASDNDWSAMLYTGGEFYFSRTYRIHIVDRVGGGDSFNAGLYYAFMQNYTPQEAIEFATAASCLDHTIEGDFNLISVAEAKALALGDGSGRVQR